MQCDKCKRFRGDFTKPKCKYCVRMPEYYALATSPWVIPIDNMPVPDYETRTYTKICPTTWFQPT